MLKNFKNIFSNIEKRKKLVKYNRNVFSDFKFIGENWNRNKKYPIVVFFGFNSWKHEVISRYFNDKRTLFITKLGLHHLRKLSKVFYLFDESEFIFWIWGKKKYTLLNVSFFLIKLLSGKNIQIAHMEDGFLRSIGAGLLHTQPLSLCFDNQSIYFDATKESELEYLLNSSEASDLKVYEDRSKVCMNLIKAARLTKYYNLEPFRSTKDFFRKEKHSILVIGQVEDDASIRYGKSKIKTNTGLVLEAIKENPDSLIYYRPHPDYWHNTRKSKSGTKLIEKLCVIVPPEDSIYDLFSVVDQVYTITSLVGFEALIYGLKVTTFGVPFYSNWGLTDDRVKIKRRIARRSLTELFSIAYLKYPTYIHPHSDQLTEFEDVASYFIVESLSCENIFSLSKTSQLFNNSLGFHDILSTPFKVLAYLVETEQYGAAKSNYLMSIIRKNFLLADFKQITNLLILSGNYDCLKSYCDYSINYFNTNSEHVINDVNLVVDLFESISNVLAKLNGRIIEQLKNINLNVLNISQESLRTKLIYWYVSCLSLNLQYNIIEHLLDDIHQKEICMKRKLDSSIFLSIQEVIDEKFDEFNFHCVYKDIVKILSLGSSRSERNYNKRYQLQSKAVELLLANIPVEDINHFEDIMQQLDLIYSAGITNKNTQILIQHLTTKIQHCLDDDQVLSDTNITNWQSLIKILNFSIQKGDYDFSELLFSFINKIGQETKQVISTKLKFHQLNNNVSSFFDCYNQLDLVDRDNFSHVILLSNVYRQQGEFYKSIDLLNTAAKDCQVPSKKKQILKELNLIKFCKESSDILKSVPQPKFPKGVIFICSHHCYDTLAMMIPCYLILKQMGYAIINLSAGVTEEDPVGIPMLDEFYGAIPLDFRFHKLINSWEINWYNKEVKSCEINFYQGFYEQLANSERKYFIDLSEEHVKKRFHQRIQVSDIALSLCNKIFIKLAKANFPTSFVSGNSHITPFSIFRDFARYKNHPMLNFICCNVSYESYYSNVGSKYSKTFCVTDMTLYPNLRQPFLARKDKFDVWFDENKHNSQYVKIASSFIGANRTNATSNAAANDVISIINEQRKKNKKIVCAFGKVSIDLAVPFDGGYAHSDMADWLNHTIQICNNSDDIFLIIKPHPHELKPEIALDLVHYFTDLIKVPFSQDKVFILNHKDINVHEIASHIDLGLLYNGSSGVELTAKGVPVMMASYFAKYDYPVNILYPQSRTHYKDFILSLSYPKPSSLTQKKASFLICYMQTNEIALPNEYSLRRITNDIVGLPKWNKSKVKDLLQDGDSFISTASNQIVEKFEKNKKNQFLNDVFSSEKMERNMMYDCDIS